MTTRYRYPSRTSSINRKDGSDLNDCPREAYTNLTLIDGRAFAINGTAHKTCVKQYSSSLWFVLILVHHEGGRLLCSMHTPIPSDSIN